MYVHAHVCMYVYRCLYLGVLSQAVIFISQITELSQFASGSNEYMNNSVSIAGHVFSIFMILY